jgi:uncharacterized membrane protein
MSFLKKLDLFLLQAKEKKVIDSEIYKDLQEFATKSNSISSTNIFINIIGFIGALAIIGGIILIISHNWWKISNITKISTYISVLIFIHIAGIFIREKYPKISSLLHFIGAGYVLAGIGLIAQIYNLSNTDGRAFLLWFIMILPMALILKHKWIGVMSIFSFYLWINIFLKQNNYYNDLINIIFYLGIFATNLIVIPKLLNSFNDCFSHIKAIGAIIIAIIICAMGFIHEISHRNIGLEISLHPIVTLILIFNIISLFYFIIIEQRARLIFVFNTILSLLLMITIFLPLFIGKENLPISIIYWILHFSFGIFLIYHGGLQINTTYINSGIWYIVIGIMLRFIDIIGTMLFSGTIFVLFGAILLIIAFLSEKFRKKLIIKIQKSNV